MSDIIEKSVVGAILTEPKALSKVYERIKPEMFSNPFYKVVFNEILRAYDTGREYTIVQLAQKMQSCDFSQEYVMQELREILVDAHAYEIKSYAESLVADYKTRRLNEIMSRTVPAAGEIDAQISTIQQELDALIESETVKIHALGEVIESVQGQYFTEPETTPIYTGFSKLDDVLGGLESGDVIVIGARPAVGKSAFTTQVILNLCNNGKKVALYNLEMSDKQVYERLLSRTSRISLTRIRRAKKFLGEEKEKFDKANSDLKKLPLYIRSGSVSVSQIRNECRHLELDCIVIDYIQLVKSDIRYQSRTSEVGAISKAIKALAMELNVPIIALSQLNRTSEARDSKEPTMGELREAGDIEQDASVILLMWNIGEDKKGLKVEKNRQGVLCKEVLSFNGDNMTFTETEETLKDAAAGFKRLQEPTPFD